MKRIILTLSMAALVLGGSSCKKSYTCSCVSNVGGVTSNVTVQATNAITAAEECNQQTQGGTSTCSLH